MEPEAASVYIRMLEVNHFIEGPRQSLAVTFAEGDKYILIDAGGNKVLPLVFSGIQTT